MNSISSMEASTLGKYLSLWKLPHLWAWIQMLVGGLGPPLIPRAKSQEIELK